MKNCLATLALLAMASPLTAHPHIFVDTGLDLYFNDTGNLESVKVTWSYDAFYSLLITEDLGLDADGDSRLDDAEKAALQGFDMRWTEGFNGDLEIFAAGERLALSGPRDYSARYAMGRITTVHTRDVESTENKPEMIELMPFDATYYTAYDLTLPVTIHGRTDCSTAVREPLQTPELMDLRQALSGLDPSMDPSDLGLGDAGAQLSTKVVVTCAAS